MRVFLRSEGVGYLGFGWDERGTSIPSLVRHLSQGTSVYLCDSRVFYRMESSEVRQVHWLFRSHG